MANEVPLEFILPNINRGLRKIICGEQRHQFLFLKSLNGWPGGLGVGHSHHEVNTPLW